MPVADIAAVRLCKPFKFQEHVFEVELGIEGREPYKLAARSDVARREWVQALNLARQRGQAGGAAVATRNPLATATPRRQVQHGASTAASELAAPLVAPPRCHAHQAITPTPRPGLEPEPEPDASLSGAPTVGARASQRSSASAGNVATGPPAVVFVSDDPE